MAALSVNCRIGSLEKEGSDSYGSYYVNCRIGSLEIRKSLYRRY